MKQSDPSNKLHHDHVVPPLTEGRRPASEFLALIFRNRVKSLLLLLCLAFALTVYVLAHKNLSYSTDAVKTVPSSTGRPLEIEVLDGAGSMRAAQQFTDILRAQGYDVVEMRKNGGGIVEQTFVLDRAGDLNAARNLAASLGVPANKIFQKIDRTLFLDITVVVGKDFSQLKAFQVSTERTNH